MWANPRPKSTLGLKLGIRCFNVESAAELQRIARQAERLQRVAPVALRVNPDVDARTHPYIATGLKENKFGVEASEALELLVEAKRHPWLEASGVACHIGSQIEAVGPYLEALDRLLDLLDELTDSGIELGHIDIGGGFGVTYQDETPFEPRELATAAKARLNGRPQTLVLEPGRFSDRQRRCAAHQGRIPQAGPERTASTASPWWTPP